MPITTIECPNCGDELPDDGEYVAVRHTMKRWRIRHTTPLNIDIECHLFCNDTCAEAWRLSREGVYRETE